MCAVARWLVGVVVAELSRRQWWCWFISTDEGERYGDDGESESTLCFKVGYTCRKEFLVITNLRVARRRFLGCSILKKPFYLHSLIEFVSSGQTVRQIVDTICQPFSTQDETGTFSIPV